MRLHRIVAWMSEAYALAALFGYIAAFGAAMIFVFIFPPATIVLFWAALFLLPVVVVVGKGLSLLASAMGRGLEPGLEAPFGAELDARPQTGLPAPDDRVR